MTTTGVAGFTLGSGSEWLERPYGSACDNLIAAEMVTAAGDVVTASETENPDLLWGLRGGGGNFGVVTEFTLRLHALAPDAYGGLLMYPRSQAPEVLRHVRGFLNAAPREVCGGALCMHAPPAPFIPPELQGAPIVTVLAAYWGDVDTGAETLAPLRQLAPAVDLMGRLWAWPVRQGSTAWRCGSTVAPGLHDYAALAVGQLGSWWPDRLNIVSFVRRADGSTAVPISIRIQRTQRRFSVWLTGLRSSAVWIARPEYLRAWIELQRACRPEGTRKRG
jgi:hypothetical protein